MSRAWIAPSEQARRVTRRRDARLWSMLAAVLLLGGCGGHASDDDDAEPTAQPAVPVRVQALERRPFTEHVEASGMWRSPGELVIAAPFAGVLEDLSVRPGDRVRAGQAVGAMVTLEAHAAERGAAILEQEADDPATRAEAQSAARLARRDRARVPLIASEAGVVLRRSVEPGAQIAEGAEVVAIAPSSDIVFEAHVPPERASSVRPGEPATIAVAGQAPRAARVVRLLPSVDPSDQSRIAWLAPTGPGPEPALGQFGAAAIGVGAVHQAVALPDSAVVEDDLTGAQRVVVVDSTQHARWVTVTLGAASEGWHELRSPALPAGTRVVIEGQRGVPEGAHVVPTP